MHNENKWTKWKKREEEKGKMKNEKWNAQFFNCQKKMRMKKKNARVCNHGNESVEWSDYIGSRLLAGLHRIFIQIPIWFMFRDCRILVLGRLDFSKSTRSVSKFRQLLRLFSFSLPLPLLLFSCFPLSLFSSFPLYVSSFCFVVCVCVCVRFLWRFFEGP